ncbi:MAG: hypothetical protein PHV82_11900, partial [Victivallaceae bacterium]|nr:hypothetical protein [Victivallaceae bacterium]
MKILKLILGIGIISFSLVMPRASAAVTLKDQGWLADKDENSDGRGDGGILNSTCKGSSNTRVRRINLNPGAKTFFLNYFTCTDPRHLKKGQQCHSSWQGASLGLYPGRWYSQ